MFFIYGFKDRARKKRSGKFACPTCQKQGKYRHMRVDRWATLFFLPIFRYMRRGEYVECQSCKAQFTPAILTR